jgi:hypothetical protein
MVHVTATVFSSRFHREPHLLFAVSADCRVAVTGTLGL